MKKLILLSCLSCLSWFSYAAGPTLIAKGKLVSALDANTQAITNLPSAVASSSPVTYAQFLAGLATVQGSTNTLGSATGLVEVVNAPTEGQIPQFIGGVIEYRTISNLVATVTNAVTSVNGVTNEVTIAGGANIQVSTAGDTITVAATNMVTLTGAQTITGAKTFSGAVAVPTSSTAGEAVNNTRMDTLLADYVVIDDYENGVDIDDAAWRSALNLQPGTDVLAPNGNGASLTNLSASAIASGTLAAARLPAIARAIPWGDLRGPIGTGGNAGYWSEEYDDTDYPPMTGHGLATASATLRSGTYRAHAIVPAGGAWPSTNGVQIVWWADSTDAADNKMDVELFGSNLDGTGRTSLASATGLTVAATVTPETVYLTPTTWRQVLTLEITLYVRSNDDAFVGQIGGYHE